MSLALDELKSRSGDQKLLERALLDCYGRFLINIPDDEFLNPVRLCFHIQEAWWWYIDHWVNKFPYLLANYSLRSFIKLVSIDCELINLALKNSDLDQVEREWREYKSKIPVRGGILINKKMDKVLLVKGFNSLQWTFPRGKIDEQEEDLICAIREIHEETGIDVSNLIDQRHYLELNLNGRSVKLFLIFNVDEFVHHKPLLVNEISECRWFNINLLRKKNNIKTFNVIEFIPHLISYINKYKQKFKFKQPIDTMDINKHVLSKSKIDFNLMKKGNWDPESMFKINYEKFGVVSTFNIEDYNTVPKGPIRDFNVRDCKFAPSEINKFYSFNSCQESTSDHDSEMDRLNKLINQMKDKKFYGSNFENQSNDTSKSNGVFKFNEVMVNYSSDDELIIDSSQSDDYNLDMINSFKFIMPYYAVLQAFMKHI